MTPKFKPGDPVWAMVTPNTYAWEAGYRGEYAGTVEYYYPGSSSPWLYKVDIPGIANPISGGHDWYCRERVLRPRRDDYQQHEPLGSRTDLDNMLYYNDLTQEEVS